MSACIYCIDNDILKKLATFDLFEQTIKLFDASSEETNILGTAKYKFKRDWEKFKGGRSRKAEDQFVNYERTIELAESLPQIADANIDSALFVQLSQFEGIDEGETVLTVYVAQVLQKDAASQVFVFTGDKRYLRALAKVNLPAIQQNFSHRFWCLEQLILRGIEAYGFEGIRDKIVPLRECDKAIKAVFGSGESSTPENALATLTSYIEELRRETGSLLHPYPN